MASKKTFKNAFQPRRAAVAGGAAAVFLMGMLFGNMTSLFPAAENREPSYLSAEQPGLPPAPNGTGGEAEAVGGERAAVVLDTTEVEWISVFLACGHERVSSDSESAVGMTLENLEAVYSDYEVRLFTAAKVKLRRELGGYCPDHYVLMLERGEIIVQRTDSDSFLPYTVMTLPVSPETLGAEARAELETGIPFDTLAEINVYFESVDS